VCVPTSSCYLYNNQLTSRGNFCEFAGTYRNFAGTYINVVTSMPAGIEVSVWALSSTCAVMRGHFVCTSAYVQTYVSTCVPVCFQRLTFLGPCPQSPLFVQEPVDEFCVGHLQGSARIVVSAVYIYIYLCIYVL